MSKYSKPFKTYDEQIDILMERGMIVDDRAGARSNLKRLGYYRLSGYWYPFRVRTPEHREGIDIPKDELNPGCRFADIVAICDFDSRLRSHLLRAIESLEVSVRAAVAYEVGKLGPFAYLDRSFWGRAADTESQQDPTQTLYDEFCRRHRMAVRDSKEQFADHFKRMYDGEVPIWVAIELWDFGTLSRFYQIMP
ncbi:MAG: Abi family protein, partial [Thermomicrobiales bacterium]